ncbi:hypothetical protein X766_33600 [Mesorhizobium sp. LSJC255A00]|uniref:transposase n=1 Tax=Mesorhizobium sp. LSJC255A00 TaxID=1287313 RepID=UPI0003CF8324|nr:transposase [Mesorhizobium sp. LSJC255A00]ESX09475.1 hypothetical protein X766_33600 [Mesorhizobium sp. LSJC255A00]
MDVFIDFEAFLSNLEKALAYMSGAHGGRPPYNPVIMLKVLVIQTANNLDERTLRLFRETLTKGRSDPGALRAL